MIYLPRHLRIAQQCEADALLRRGQRRGAPPHCWNRANYERYVAHTVSMMSNVTMRISSKIHVPWTPRTASRASRLFKAARRCSVKSTSVDLDIEEINCSRAVSRTCSR